VRQREEALAGFPVPRPSEPEPLIHSSTLRYLNVHWAIDPPAPPEVGRLASVKTRARARAAQFVCGLFARYMQEERDFFAHNVRMQNAFARNYDELAQHLTELAEAAKAEAQRLADRDEFLHGLLETRLEALEERLEARTSQ
jgi:hypothetical protein